MNFDQLATEVFPTAHARGVTLFSGVSLMLSIPGRDVQQRSYRSETYGVYRPIQVSVLGSPNTRLMMLQNQAH